MATNNGSPGPDTIVCATDDTTGIAATFDDDTTIDIDANVNNTGGNNDNGNPVAVEVTVNPGSVDDNLIHVFSIANGFVVEGNDDGMRLDLNQNNGSITIDTLLGQISGINGEALDLETSGADIHITVGSTGVLSSTNNDGIVANNLNSGNFTLISSGTISGGNGDAVEVGQAGIVDITNSSFTSMVGSVDGLDIYDSDAVVVKNGGGLIAGLTQEGIDADEIHGGPTNAVDISNSDATKGGGIIAGYWDGVDINDVWNDNVLIDNSDKGYGGGLILGLHGDGVDIEHADGDVTVKNSGTSGDTLAVDDASIDPDASLVFFGAAPAPHAAGIFGDKHGIVMEDVEGAVKIYNDYGTIFGKYEDGVDLEDVDEYVYINNHYGSIQGGDDGVDIEEVEGDYRIDKTGALIGDFSVVINNSAGNGGTYGIKGQDDGIDIETVEKGSIYINNYDGYIEGVDENGIKIRDTQARNGTKGNVEIDNSGGSVKGGDDGIDIFDIDGNVRIANGGGVAVGYGSIVGTGDEGIDIEVVDYYVFIDNRGGTITGGDGDGVKIENVDGDDLIDEFGSELTTDKYAVVVLSASGISGTENGVNIKDVGYGGVRVESGDGYGTSYITGYNEDGVKIRDVDNGPVEVINRAYSTIMGKDDGVYIKDTDGDPGEDVTVTNYYHGTIKGEYGSGVQIKDAEEDARIHNWGDILGNGGWHSAVIDLDTKDGAYIDNYYGGVIKSNSGAWDDIAIKSRTHDGTWINNWGTITGRVILDNEDDTFNNYSDNSWNVSGKNFFGWYDYDVLNNTGTINVNDWTAFFGLDKLNNVGGLINMHDWDYPDTDDKLFTTGKFIGREYDYQDPSYLAVDTYFGPWGDSDLLKVKKEIKGQTEIIVYKLNQNPGGFNDHGIDVVSYKEEYKGGDCADYFCKEGDTFFISALSPYYVNIGGYGTIEDGLFAQFLHHDKKHKDYEFHAMWGPGAVNAPGVITGAQNIFYDTLRVVEDNKYGYQFNGTGGGGADLPIEEAPVASDNGTNAGVWVKARGSWTERDTSIEQNGVEFDTSSSQDIYSILGGADVKPWGEDSPFRAGLFGGYVMSALDFDLGTGTSADYEGGVVGGYIAYNNGAFYVDATVKGDLLNTTYSFAGIDADADVTSIGGSLNTGYRMYMGPGFIEPIASLEFVHSQVDDFDDGGASVDFSNGQSIRAGAGAKVGTNFATAGGTTTELSLLGKVWNEFEDANTVSLDDGMGNTASFSDDISGIFGEVAATATIVSADGTASGFFSVGGQFGEDSMSLRAEAGARKGF